MGIASQKIIIKGARQHNLKNIDVEIERNKLVVITGLSGSGKSSLAFDTIYAEGQRRYVESLSSYARQFLGLMEKPDMDYIEGLSPAISIEQKATVRNPRSTVGTVTEIHDYMRLLFAHIGKPHCWVCDRPIQRQTVQQIVDTIFKLGGGTKIYVLAPVVRGRKGQHKGVLDEVRKEGFLRVRIDGKIYSIDKDINLEKNKLYLGPLDYSSVENLGVGLEEKILGWQWLSSVSWLVYSIMIILYGFIPNYGVVVVLFAVLIKLVTYPLMAKQLRSSKKMQEISPLMNQIKIKYKNNPTLQQQKMAALFQENKINPLAGCLPLLIQMPVLMSVFMVFRNTIEFRGESFFLWINDLSAADTLFSFGGIPINILPFLMAGSMYYTMKLSSASQPAGGDPAQEATQQMMKYMFPGMMFFLFYSFPSGLNLYYLCFNVMQIAQQKIINNEKTETVRK